MTDQAELTRVDRIHDQAEMLNQFIKAGDYRDLQAFSMTGGVTWSRAELLAWPEKLSDLKAWLQRPPPRSCAPASVVGWAGDQWAWSACPDGHFPGSLLYEAIRVGMCLFRESRAFKEHVAEQARIHAGPTAEQVRGAFGQRLRCKRCTVEECEEHGCVIDVPSGLCGHCALDLMAIAREKPEPKCACGAILERDVSGLLACWVCDDSERLRGKTHPLLGRHDPYTGRFLDKEIGAYAMQKADDELSGRRAAIEANLRPDVTRPVVSLAEQAHPLGHYSGRTRRYR